MSVNLNSQNNPQLLQSRLNVREKEIDALKIQNRHLLGQLGELEHQLKANRVDTVEIARQLNQQMQSVVNDMQSTMKTSFELIQSTMRGIYQQSQRAEKAAEAMASHSRDLEMRMNDQRKTDQAFYQDKIFATIQAFTDRFERQIDVRLKSLSSIEILNTKQNELLNDLEGLKANIAHMQRNSDAVRGDVGRIEKNASEANLKLIDVIVQTQSTEELVRDSVQEIQNHRNEFKVIRSDIRTAIDLIKQAGTAVNAKARENAQVETQIIHDMIQSKQKELETIETQLVQNPHAPAAEDAAVVLKLLRAQKEELARAAEDAKSYIRGQTQNDSHQRDDSGPLVSSRKPEVETFTIDPE